MWGPTEDVSSAGTATPVAVIGNDGSVVAVWERLVAGGSLEETSLRSGSGWGAAHQTERVHPNATIPSLATDRRGDFATLATPYNGTGHPVLVSWYDSAPPLLEASPVGDMFAGRPITFTAFVVDAWSTAGTPEWVFGDGATGSGLTVTHTYVAPGTYAGHMTVTDAAGNTATADTGVVVRPAARVRLGNARFVAKWKQSRVSGTLHVTCTAPIGGTYVVNVMRGTALKLHVSPHLSRDGTVTRAIRLPATLVPGTYRVALLSTFKAVRSASLEARLAAPAEGVADSASLSRTRAGKAARALTAATALWARFHLAAVPGARSSS
ncbi:MAG TPA: PKD domain-containing protein [Gaiellales bacterium]|nr:PKD domain-containing protein [Gaiellales bacterium]